MRAFGGLGHRKPCPACHKSQYDPNFAAVSATRLKWALAPQGGTLPMAITMDAREAPLGRALKGTRNAAERARAFRRARGHSLRRKILRVVLPVGAAGFTAYYALTLGVSWQMGAGRLKVGEV